MIFPRVKKVGKDNHWKRTSSTVFGEYKGYWFNMGDGTGFKYITASIHIPNEAVKSHLIDILGQNKKSIGYHEFEVLANYVFIKFNENITSTSREKLDSALSFLASTFEQLGLPQMNDCHSCQGKTNLKYYDVNGEGKLFCITCANALESQFDESWRRDRLEEKNYFIGFVGALLFSLAGVVGWIILQQIGYMSSVMALVIAFLSLKGYLYFKGKMGTYTRFIIVVTGMMSIVAANYLSYVTSFLLEGYTINDFLFSYGTNKDLSREIHANLGISFVLSVFVWVWLFFTIIHKQPKLKLAREIA